MVAAGFHWDLTQSLKTYIIALLLLQSSIYSLFQLIFHQYSKEILKEAR